MGSCCALAWAWFNNVTITWNDQTITDIIIEVPGKNALRGVEDARYCRRQYL